MTDPTHDALYQAVLANPADDLPRLVYADWLEENAGPCRGCDGEGSVGHVYDRGMRGVCGDCQGTGRDQRAAHAEFIRVQCELAGIDPHTNCGGYYCQTYDTGNTMHVDCRGEQLRCRERELWPIILQELPPLPQHRLLTWVTTASWIPDTNPSPNWAQAIVSRGFVSQVRCAIADWYGEDETCSSCAEQAPDWETGVIECRRCDSIGVISTAGVGPRVVRSHPITRVEIMDQEPIRLPSGASDRWVWWRWPDDEHGVTIEPGYLPGELWDSLLISGEVSRGRRVPHIFPTANDALAALSSTLLHWART